MFCHKKVSQIWFQCGQTTMLFNCFFLRGAILYELFIHHVYWLKTTAMKLLRETLFWFDCFSFCFFSGVFFLITPQPLNICNTCLFQMKESHKSFWVNCQFLLQVKCEVNEKNFTGCERRVISKFFISKCCVLYGQSFRGYVGCKYTFSEVLIQ